MAAEPTSSRRLLVLAAPDDTTSAYIRALESCGSVRIVHSASDAVAALREESFDAVLAATPELLPLAFEAGHAPAETVLSQIAQGVCIVARDGTLLWSNPALRALSSETIEAVRQTCVGIIAELSETPTTPGEPRVRRRAVTTSQEHYYELVASALPSPEGGAERVVGLVNDVTAITRLREKIDAIDAAGRELVALNADATARLEVSERLRLLEEKLIYYFQDLLNFSHFAVLVLDPSSGRLDPVLTGGFPESVKNLELYARQEGNGISGYVAATGQSFLCADVSLEPRYLLGLEAARSSLTVPLRLLDRIVGVLNVESDRVAAFTEEDRQFAEIFSRYIAAALHILKLLAAERTEVTSQVASDVRDEMAEPLNDIIAEATRLLNSGPAATDAVARLRTIIEHVDTVKRRLQSVVETPAIRGLSREAAVTDPLLEGRRVLVADDEDIIRETIADVLAKVGALTVMARNGEEAVSMIRAQHFDVVLSDIKMPYKNGYEVFAAARETNPDVHVVLITGFGYDPDHSIVRASREGLAGVLFKPFAVDQLFEIIHKALGGGSA